MKLSMKCFLRYLSIVFVILPGLASASTASVQVYTNNMSDVSVQISAYSGTTTPAKLVDTWCVDTGSYEKHELKAPATQLSAAVMHDGCKEPTFMKRMFPLASTSATSGATLYRLTGSKGKYSITGPFQHEMLK